MSNTFLLKDDNSVQHTVKSPVIEKTSNIESINFICPKTYNDMDMSTFDLVLTYKLPISKAVKIVTLEIADSNYKENYILYKLPATAKTITGETGEVELSLTQMKVELDPDTGKQIKYVRSFTPAILNILPVINYVTVEDSGLTQLAELYLANKAGLEALKKVADSIYAEKADDITVDAENKLLQLTNKGEKIGTGVSLEDLNAELVETGSHADGNINIVNI